MSVAVDVTHLTEEEREKVGTTPIDGTLVNGVLVPDDAPKKRVRVKVKDLEETAFNKKMIAKYTIGVFDADGLMNYQSPLYPSRDLMKKFIREKNEENRKDLMSLAGPKRVEKLLVKFIPRCKSPEKAKLRTLFTQFIKPKPVRKSRSAAKKTTKSNAQRKKKPDTVIDIK